jgi:TP901 family phage tail tape measure protein
MNTGMPTAVLSVLVQAKGINKTNAGLATTHAGLERTAKAGQRMGRGLEIGIKAAAVGTGAALVAATKVGMDFERQIDSLGAVSGASGRQMAVLERQALKLGESTAFTAREVGEAQTELAKGGLSIEQIYGGGVQASLSLAAAGELELGEAAETTVNSMKLFGLGGKEAVSIADMLATAANRTTADVSDFAMALKQGGSVAKLAGYGMNETVAVLEALAESGIKNSDAGTSMKAAFIQLLKPTEKQAELAEELGIHWQNQNGELKRGAGISRELRVATDDMTKAERAKTLAILAGTDGVRTLNALYASSPKAIRALEQANAQQGTAQDVARKKMDNFQGSLEEMQGAAETLGIRVYQTLKPSLEGTTDAATNLAREVSAIFDDRSLSGEEKFLKSLDLITERTIDAAADIYPELVEKGTAAAVKAGPQFVGALASGIIDAWGEMDFLGRLFSVALMIRAVGGRDALLATGQAIGRLMGLGVSRGVAETVADVPGVAPPAAKGPVSVPVAPPTVRTTSSPAWLGIDGTRRMQAEAAQMAAASSAMDGLYALPDLEKEMASRGKAGSRSFVRSFAANIRTAGPRIASALKGAGSRAMHGLATWGLGGLMVGGITKEIVGGNTGQKLGSALEGAGVGAAIGSAIAPGIGTAMGAAAGIAASQIKEELSSTGIGDELGIGIAEDLEATLPPRLRKALNQKELGALDGLAGQLRRAIRIAVDQGAGADALKPLRAQLAQVLDVRDEIQQPRAGVEKQIDLLRSGIATRMSDINRVFHSNIAQINQGWVRGGGQWRRASVENMHAAVAAIKAGMRAGVISTEVGTKYIDKLLRGIRVTEGKDPYGIARGFSVGWVEAGKINNRQIAAQIKTLNKMPKGAREAAQDAMIGMARRLEADGKLVKGSAARLSSALITKFGKTNKQIVRDAAAGGDALAGIFANLVNTVSGYLQDLGINVSSVLKAFGVNKPVKFGIKAVEAGAGGVGRAVGDVIGSLTGGNERQSGGFIVPGTGSGDTYRTALPVGSFVENREAVKALPFQKGGVTPVALEPGERVYLPQEVRTYGQRNLEARNAAVPRFQKGGLHGKPQMAGPAGPLRDLGQGAASMAWNAARDFVQRQRPKAATASSGSVPGYVGPPPGMKQLGDNAWVDSHTLAIANLLASKFGVTITDGWRPQNASYGASNSSHKRGTPSNPGAVDLAPPSTALQAWAGAHIAGLTENDIHDWGSGLHNHIAFFKLGGLIQELAIGGGVNLNKTFPGAMYPSSAWSALPEMSFPIAAALAEAAGKWAGTNMPGVTMAQVSKGEGALKPGSMGDDNGDGSPDGYGWLAITRPYGGSYGVGSLGGYPGMLNPVSNAAVAAKMYGAQGLSAWYGDKYVTSSNAHYTGGYDISNSLGGMTFGEAIGSPKSGEGGLSESQKKLAEGKRRKGNYEKRLRTLEDEATQAQSLPAKQSKLWRLIKFWGRTGIFEEDERAHVLDAVQRAAAQTKPQGAVNVLSSLAQYAKGHGEITGQDPSNFRSLEKAIERAQERGREQREKTIERQKKHVEAVKARVAGKIGKRAAFPELVAQLAGLRRRADEGEEYASQLVSLEPENVTEAYVGLERGAYGDELNRLLAWRNMTVRAQEAATREIGNFQQQIAGIEALNIGVDKGVAAPAGKKGSKQLGGLLEYFSGGGKSGSGKGKKGKSDKDAAGVPSNTYGQYKKVAYKIPLLEEAITNAKTMRDETWTGELEEIQGLSGPQGMLSALPSEPQAGAFGGRIFEIQNSIRELGLKVGDATSGISELKELEAQLNVDWRKRFFVSEAQRNTIRDFESSYPGGRYAGMFATGGYIGAGQWGIAGETGEPEVVQGPARVFNPSESAEMLSGGGTPTLVIEELRIDGDGNASARFDERDVELIVKRVIKDGRVTGRLTPGGR